MGLAGRMTLEYLAILDEKVEQLLRLGYRHLLLNMIDVTDISSSGLVKMLSLQSAVQAKSGALALIEPSPVVEHVLDLAGLADVFSIYDDEQKALYAFGHRPASAAH